MFRILLVCVAGWMFSACASIVSDNKSTTYIESEPEGARCELHGQDFKRVITTPNSLSLPAEAAPITVACKADGYRTTTVELDTDVDGWIWGNILLGGGIGFLVDLARDAGEIYPPQMTVLLDPESFESPESRDAWFRGRQKTLREQWDQVIAQEKANCEQHHTELCRSKIEALEQKRDQELEELERQKDTSDVDGS